MSVHLAFFGWCFPPSYSGPSFLAKNFFYINCKLIQQSAGFESHFTQDEKAAVRLSVNNIDDKNVWILLGYNADKLIYGPVSDTIQSRYGLHVYEHVMLKSIVFCMPGYIKKVIRQVSFYYFGFNFNERIPHAYFDYRQQLEYSAVCLPGISNGVPAWKVAYGVEVSDILSKGNSYKLTSNRWTYLLWLSQMCLSSLLSVLAVIYTALTAIRGRLDIIGALFISHFLVLLTIAVVHTIDIGRYSHALFPLFVIILLLTAGHFLNYVVNWLLSKNP